MVNRGIRNISASLEKMAAPSSVHSRVSLGHEDRVQEFYMIKIENLTPFKNQARKEFDEKEIQLLASSIKKHGVRQPLTVVSCEDKRGVFEIVSGERRFRAAKLCGMDSVPCIILKDKSIVDEVAIVENIHRKDLNPIELGNAFNSLLNKKIFSSQTEIATALAISESKVSEYIKYFKVPEETKELMLSNGITTRDEIRKFLKSLNSKNPTNKNEIKSFSVMRIISSDGGFKLQVGGVSKLPPHKKDELKQELLNFIKEKLN